MIKNGRPCTIESNDIDVRLIDENHSEKEIEIICEWIRSNFIRTKTANFDKSSYGLKHILEDDTGIYLTNNEFKDVMLMCEYEPVNPNALNWYYCISKKSPALKR